MAKRKVLVTGMSGRIGRAILKRLGDKYDFTAMNRNPMEGVRCVTADITDLDAIRPHFEGQDTVVHLAAALGSDSEDDTRDYIERNVWGTYTVFEAARQAGVRRVIFASSGSTIISHTLESPLRELESGEYDKLPPTWPMLTHESPVRPNSIYGVSKVWGEALARYYVDAFGLSAICIRFGYIPEGDRPEATRTYAVWCSHDDASQMVDKCIEADDSLRFDIFYAVSDNKYNYRDISHARDVIGYVPTSRAEDFR